MPRYVATKYAKVNARGGPGDDYKLLWTYQAKGVPLQIIEETFDWRRVCDPDGGLAWVHRRTVDGERRVMNLAQADAPLLASPRTGAKIAARLAPRATAVLAGCKDDWCRIKAGHASGWSPVGALWGEGEAPQCRPPHR